MFPRRLSPRKLCVFPCLSAALCLTGIYSNAQANVNENQHTYIYVDANNGSDGSSGSSSAPLQTIQAAINAANSYNRQGVAVKVIVNAGVYRETVDISSYASTGAALTVESSTPGAAVIAGSDVLTGWSDRGSGIYAHSWNQNLGACAVPSGWPSTFPAIARRTEMVFVNGNPLTQVVSSSQLRPGTFFVDDSADTMLVAPPAGVSIWNSNVEAAVRSNTLNIAGRSNVVLRGLVFRHAANCMNTSGANIYNSTNVLVDSIQALWNNWGGLGIYSSNNITVQGSVASHNGGVGLMGARDQNAIFSYNESDYNNWRGAQAALFDWGMGGTKLMYMRNATVQNHFSYNNQAQGLWFDTDNENITINNATLVGNVMAGLQLEADQGPVRLQNSLLCSNGAGVNVLNVQKLSITNNALYNNGGTGIYDGGEIFVAGFSGGHAITNWLTGEYYNLVTTGTVVSGNVIANASNGQIVFGTYLNGNDWSQFASTLNSHNNQWYDPANWNSFMLPYGKHVGMPDWQAAVGSDYSSAWSAPSNAPGCSAPAPDYADFALGLNREHYTRQNGQATVRIRLSSFGEGPVNLSVAGLPGGVSGAFSDNNIAQGQLTLTLSAAPYAGTQTVPVTIWATTADRVHSMTFNVHVAP